MEPERDEALDGEAAGEGVEGEQRRQPQHHAPRAVQPERGADRLVGDLAGGTSTRGETRVNSTARATPSERVADDHHAVARRRRVAGRDGQPATTAPPASVPAAVANEPASWYQAKTRGPPPVADELGERRLLDGEERADLVAARADDADRRRDQQHREHRRGDERHAGGEHQDRADDQDPAPPDPVRMGGQPQRDGGVAEERQGQQQPDLAADRPIAARYRTRTTERKP